MNEVCFLLVVHHVNLSIQFQARRVAAAEGGGLENMFIKRTSKYVFLIT